MVKFVSPLIVQVVCEVVQLWPEVVEAKYDNVGGTPAELLADHETIREPSLPTTDTADGATGALTTAEVEPDVTEATAPPEI